MFVRLQIKEYPFSISDDRIVSPVSEGEDVVQLQIGVRFKEIGKDYWIFGGKFTIILNIDNPPNGEYETLISWRKIVEGNN